MNIKKIALWTVILLLIAAIPQSGIGSAETTIERKIVYVVMDDSGSMSNNFRWPRAQYAMEVLSGLLNPQDRLELYFLNSIPRHFTIDLSAGGINNSMRKIVNTGSPNSNTPFGPVESAYEDLMKECKGTDIYSDYWFVVFTDGAYNQDVKGNNKNSKTEYICNRFKEYAGQHYGSKGDGKLHLIYCTIGPDSETMVINDTDRKTAELEELGIYCYSAGDKKLVETMGKIADRISGRSRFTGSSFLKQVDQNTIQVSSSIPLFNYAVLVQGSKAGLKSVQTEAGKRLNISRSANIIEPPSGKGLHESLYGSVCTVDNGADHISAGTYTLTFDGAVNTDQVIVLFEPALEVRLDHYLGDALIPDGEKPGSRVHVGHEYSASAYILEYGTQKKISLDELPAGSEFKIEVSNGARRDSEMICKGSEKVTVKDVTDNPVHVKATLSIPGFNDIVGETEYSPISEPVYSVSVPDDKKGGVQGQELIVHTEEIKPGRKEKYFDFKIMVNNKPVQGINSLVSKGDLYIVSDLTFELDYPQNGILRVYPVYTGKEDISVPHTFSLYNSFDNAVLGQAKVSILLSEFKVRAAKEKISKRESELRDNAAEFVFTLVVDGKDVDANEYEPLTFSVSGPNSSGKVPVITSARDGKKWRVTAAYNPGMPLGDYQITASLKNQPLDNAATLSMGKTDYTITVKPEKKTLRQSELADNEIVYEIKLKEQGKSICPDVLMVEDWGGYRPGIFLLDDADDKGLTAKMVLNGDITTKPGSYKVVLAHLAPSGEKTTKTLELDVEPSVYTIDKHIDRQLVFSAVDEFAANDEQYRFDVLVDGRPLSDTEMQMVTGIKVEPEGTATGMQIVSSGYDITPRVSQNWLPATNAKTVEYTVTCTAPGASADAVFTWKRVDYTVECISGSGMQIGKDDLLNNTSEMKFRVYGDGEPLTYDLVNGNFRVEVNAPFRRHIRLDTQTEPDGTITVVPVSRSGSFMNLFTRVWIPKGEMTVTVSYKNGAGSGAVEITGAFILNMVLPYIIAISAITLICMWIFKKRFDRSYGVFYYYCEDDGIYLQGTEDRDLWLSASRPGFLNVISPFGRERIRVDGTVFRATGSIFNRQRGMMVEMRASSEPKYKAVVAAGRLRTDKCPSNVSCRRNALEPGWVLMNAGEAFARYESNGDVVIFKYNAKNH